MFVLEGSSELIETVYETGLGSKNSEGFGMWEPYEDKNASTQCDKI